jgi:hypothetical protein
VHHKSQIAKPEDQKRNMSTATSTSRRSVCFNDELNIIHVVEAFASDLLWSTAEDDHENKREMKFFAVKVRREGVDRLIENSFANPAADTQKSLNEFARHTDGRGLERLFCAKHYEERMTHRVIAIKAILMGQKEALDRELKLADVTEQLRELSLRYCCTAKIFARRMGKADEYACYKKSKASTSICNNSCSSSSKKCKRSSKKAPSKKEVAGASTDQQRQRSSLRLSSLRTASSTRTLAIAA